MPLKLKKSVLFHHRQKFCTAFLVCIAGLCLAIGPAQSQQKEQPEKPTNLKEAIAILRPLLEKDNYWEKKWTEAEFDHLEYRSYEVKDDAKSLTIIGRQYQGVKYTNGQVVIESLNTSTTTIPFNQMKFKGFRFFIKAVDGYNKGKHILVKYDYTGPEFTHQLRLQIKGIQGVNRDESDGPNTSDEMALYSMDDALLAKINTALQDVLRFSAKPVD